VSERLDDADATIDLVGGLPPCLFGSEAGIWVRSLEKLRAAKVLALLHCLFVRGRHEPVRHPLGAWRCQDCGSALADFAEAGTMDDGYVWRESETKVRH